MNDTNSILIPFKLVQIANSDYPNADDGWWAEPEINVAAHKMREISSNKKLQLKLSENATLNIKSNHSYKVVGAFLRRQLTFLVD
jgi:hypothetical protein